MAGEIRVLTRLTQQFLDEIIGAGLTLNIQIDCSHNAYVRTVRSDRPNQPIISKPIELDTTLICFTNPKQLGAALSNLQGARSTSPLFQLYQSLTRLAGGVSALTMRNIKIEFPNFDTTIVNIMAPPISIADAIQACQANSIANFNALPRHVRRSMGMYLRTARNEFQLVGTLEPEARIAVP